MSPVARCILLACLVLPLAGCEGVQSVLSPEGLSARRIALLAHVLFIGGAVILVGIVALTALSIYGGAGWRNRLASEKIVIGGGIVFPVVVLTALLVYGLAVTRVGGTDRAGPDALRIAVVGERWWWRVIYTDADGRRFESANEIRIPTGRPVELALTTADVIHSFWVPKLAGKLDMIPGRTNYQTVVAEVPGVSRGQCAEYCGGAHALMSFFVVAMPPDEFEAWLVREAGPAAAPGGAAASQGRQLFLRGGCGACHKVRGTPANGAIGPDLTHVGGRLSIAAATLETSPQAFARWIAENQHIKPENLMPPFRIFADDELDALATYLTSLR
ncbi:cytochrome c oxidase subunit II [Desertibaculum subflavum]|uniref:cytochrome c oxidase subunit II n=1 Tax=Desertibaculum subflavum TaxID=2268458 RepID=UPI000E66220F